MKSLPVQKTLNGLLFTLSPRNTFSTSDRHVREPVHVTLMRLINCELHQSAVALEHETQERVQYREPRARGRLLFLWLPSSFLFTVLAQGHPGTAHLGLLCMCHCQPHLGAACSGLPHLLTVPIYTRIDDHTFCDPKPSGRRGREEQIKTEGRRTPCPANRCAWNGSARAQLRSHPQMQVLPLQLLHSRVRKADNSSVTRKYGEDQQRKAVMTAGAVLL